LNQAEDTSSWNYSTILDQLTHVYNNPNKVQEAEDRLYSIKQGTDLLLSYIAKFEYVLYKVYRQNWPDINKISIFCNSLNSTICSQFLQQLNLLYKYSDFVQVVQQLARRSIQTTVSDNNSTKYYKDNTVVEYNSYSACID
jgi:hypothetical protein